MMNATDPVPSSPPAAAPVGASSPESGAGTRWRHVRWFAARAVALLGSFVLLVAVLTGFAASYTSRSEFCRSCHIMEPYYVSWQESSHKDVACVTCHFPPGAGEKVRGKMLGLVQLVKYVTGSAGPRPAAEIPDASCLRSGCHETRLLSGRIDFKGMPFDHRPHLEETRRGKQLRCTSCHSQIVQGSHMTVTTSTCFLCHFKDGRFNEGLGTCTRCHQIPDEIDLGGVPFKHDLAYERGVDCSNCHADLIRGKGEVPRERCGVCHNRESDWEQIKDHTFMHQKHVTDHKVDCLNCHLEIKHSVDKERLAHSAADCATCHPNHHREQVNMLQGIGAKTIQPQLSRMTARGVACSSCHRQQGVSATGAVLLKGSMETCHLCHDAAANTRLLEYRTRLRSALKELEGGILRAREALPKAGWPAARVSAVEAELDDLSYDLNFVRIGNDIHNTHYAATVVRTLTQRVTALCKELRVAAPAVTLPDPATLKEAGAAPAAPAAKPHGPEEKPAEASAKPERPAAPPETPSEKPDTPAANPPDPETKPEAKPEMKPEVNPEAKPEPPPARPDDAAPPPADSPAKPADPPPKEDPATVTDEKPHSN